MTDRLPPRGSIIRYPYLWLRQSKAGETEGRKDRPVCLVMSVFDARHDLTHMMMLAISSKPPSADQRAFEIPDTERRRAGLDTRTPAWIVVSEYNYDIAEQSFYYEPAEAPLGAFSLTFMGRISDALTETLERRTGRIDRTQ